MKAQNEIEATRHSIASRWACSCSLLMISRFSLWIPPPTHRLAAPSARQGRQPARKLCRCSSNSSRSEVLRTHRQFDHTICMPAMLGLSAWFCFSQVESWASLTHQCFSWLVKWWNCTFELAVGPQCVKSHAHRQDAYVYLDLLLFYCIKTPKEKAQKKTKHAITLSSDVKHIVCSVLEVTKLNSVFKWNCLVCEEFRQQLNINK